MPRTSAAGTCLSFGATGTSTFTVSVAMEIGDTVARNLNGLKVGVIAPAGRARMLHTRAGWGMCNAHNACQSVEEH